MANKLVTNFFLSEKMLLTNDNKQSDTIAIVDFLNLARARKPIADRPDAKFRTIDEFNQNITEIALQIRSMGDFEKIYIVTKSFKFDKNISYKDIPRIIMWGFCMAVPEWTNKICLVLVNGINDKDKEADDRALFIIYHEYAMTTGLKVIILSNDNFDSLNSHFLRDVTLNFYWVESMGPTWETSKIISTTKRIFPQNKSLANNEFVVIHPCSNTMESIKVY